jgi:hypothetical protein
MTHDDVDNDHVLSLVASLTARDVDRRRGERLRVRCHASVRSRALRAIRPARSDRRWMRRVIASGAAGAWCVVYLIEIIKRAAVIYGH